MKEFEMPTSEKQPTFGRRAIDKAGHIVSVMLRLVLKLALILVVVAFGLFVGSFLQFTSKVANTVEPDEVEPAEAIVVLTGGATRIATALQLLSDKKGARLLITGVNVDTQKSDIQAMHQNRSELFECCVDVERVAEDTVGNAVETAKWMQGMKYSSAIVVTSAYHMPRSLLEFRRQMRGVKLTPYPVPLDTVRQQGWWRDPAALRFMANEFLKYLGARLRDYVEPRTLDVLRGNVLGGS